MKNVIFHASVVGGELPEAVCEEIQHRMNRVVREGCIASGIKFERVWSGKEEKKLGEPLPLQVDRFYPLPEGHRLLRHVNSSPGQVPVPTEVTVCQARFVVPTMARHWGVGLILTEESGHVVDWLELRRGDSKSLPKGEQLHLVEVWDSADFEEGFSHRGYRLVRHSTLIRQLKAADPGLPDCFRHMDADFAPEELPGAEAPLPVSGA